MADELVLKFAKLLIQKENLGLNGHTDMISVGCSAADAIGHHFGPESHEIMDYYLYLDSYLDEFFSFLDERYGRDEYWVVLVSDHGANPMPEALQIRGIDAKRVLTSDVGEDLDEIETRAKKKLGLTSVVIENVLGGVYLNFLESDARGIPRSNVRKVVASLLRTLPYIEDTYTIDDFKSRKTKAYIENYERSFDKDLSADIMYRLKEHYMIHGPYGTSHGSVYEYDTHVPVVFSIPGMQPSKVDRRVATVDVAPTLAALLNIKADKKVDGQVMGEMLNER
jgi:arylsulfatase A-like enzyme